MLRDAQFISAAAAGKSFSSVRPGAKPCYRDLLEALRLRALRAGAAVQVVLLEPAPYSVPADGPNLQNFFENFANFWRARSRLYQNEILQQNMRLTAFFKLYKICILLHRCNLKIFAKNRFENSAIFVKIQQHFCKI